MIDIEKLSQRELIDLHDRIVTRLHGIRREEIEESLSNLKFLDLVFFKNQYALVMKINQKTVDILCETGERWRISPSFVTKVEDSFEKVRGILEKKFPEHHQKLLLKF